MSVNRYRSIALTGLVAIATVGTLASSASAIVSNKLVLQGVFGAEVNLTQVEAKAGWEAEDLCTVASKDTCQGGTRSGVLGGFNAPESVAVGPKSTGNKVYVADANNDRIEEFSPGGESPIVIWGPATAGAEGTGDLAVGSSTVTAVVTISRTFIPGQIVTGTGIPVDDQIVTVSLGTITLSKPVTVTASAAPLAVAATAGIEPANAEQKVTIEATGGTFKLGFSTPEPSESEDETTAIKYSATAAEVQSALEALANIGAGNVAVDGAPGGPYTVTFEGTRYADTYVDKMSVLPGGLTGGNAEAKVSTIEPGGQYGVPESIATDQEGDLYIFDKANHRVDKYTSAGAFVWMVGEQVNRTKVEEHAPEAEQNLCTAASHNVCQAGVESESGSTKQGAIKPANFGGNVLAVGGPLGLLYVGDQGRVQEFDTNTGAWVREVSLVSFGTVGYVKALAVDGSGDLYVAYSKLSGEFAHGVNVLTSNGNLIREIDAEKGVAGLALDPFGRLAIVSFIESTAEHRGELFEATSGVKLGEFAAKLSSDGIGFNPDAEEEKEDDQLYVAVSEAGHEQGVEVYAPAPVAEILPKSCEGKAATGFKLVGEVNPKGVSETKMWFRYGTKAKDLGLNTPVQGITTGETYMPVQATVEGLSPNESYFYQLVGEDANYKPGNGEPPLEGAELECFTLYVPPVVEGEPESSDVTFSSAVLQAKVNPENAKTRYGFEYGACVDLEDEKDCPGKLRTTEFESSEYEDVGVTQSVAELEPATTYRYRIYAESENKNGTEKTEVFGKEASFETTAAPSPSADTAPASDVTSFSVLLNGTVDSGGAGATYSFQLGVYNPAGTVYGTIVSGPIGAEAGEESERFALAGLRPGVTYAYRITILSAYTPRNSVTGEPEPLVGETVLFTTQGVPAVLVAPAPLQQLSVPAITFPGEASKTMTSPKLTRAQKLTRALKACAKVRKVKRQGCEKQARKQYGATAKKKTKK